jgi:hypothetical protein
MPAAPRSTRAPLCPARARSSSPSTTRARRADRRWSPPPRLSGHRPWYVDLTLGGRGGSAVQPAARAAPTAEAAEAAAAQGAFWPIHDNLLDHQEARHLFRRAVRGREGRLLSEILDPGVCRSLRRSMRVVSVDRRGLIH